MNTIEPKFKVSDHINGIVVNVFETMLSVPAVSLVDVVVALPRERISGCIGIGGETVNGTIYLHFPTKLAGAAAHAMLQTPTGQEVTDGDVNDVIGELSNMVGARLKSLLNDADIFCAVSTPSVIRGAFAVEAPQDVTAEKFYFECLGQRFAVEVHLQFVACPDAI